jgi:hypothetical protein
VVAGLTPANILLEDKVVDPYTAHDLSAGRIKAPPGKRPTRIIALETPGGVKQQEKNNNRRAKPCQVAASLA